MARSSSQPAQGRDARRVCRLAWLLAGWTLALPSIGSGQTPLPTAWVPDGPVYAMARHENTVYLGGLFTKLTSPAGDSEVIRSNLAAVDLVTGVPTAWNPGSTLGVFALAHDGEHLYAGGSFGEGGAIVELDLDSGAPTGWSVSTPGSIHALGLEGGTLYAGGQFDSIAGEPRANLAAFDLVTSALAAWIPETNGLVFALAAAGGVVRVGGLFGAVGGQSRNFVAAVDAITGDVLPWNPSPNSAVTALAVDGGTVYAGGYFEQIGGATRNRVAALDAATGIATAWNPNVNAAVRTIALGNGAVWIGGSFSRVGGVAHALAAAVDPVSGAVLWSPGDFGYGFVWSVAAGGNVAYLGGEYRLTGDTVLHLGGYAWSTAGLEERELASAVTLAPPIPHPVRGAARLRFAIPAACDVTLEVFDPSGRRVAAPLVRAPRAAGAHEVAFDARAWAPGAYLYRLTAGARRASGRMVVLD